MEFSSGRQDHMYIRMIMTEYETVHIMLPIKGFSKLIKRLVRTTENIFPIMGKAVAL